MKSIYEYEKVSPLNTISDDAIFIWLDILGFASIVDSDNKYKDLLDILIKFQNLFNNNLNYSATVISDGIVLEIQKTTYENFVSILHDIGSKQLEFILEHKYFLRGGIAVGNKLIDNNSKARFISNGLSRAVKIENDSVEYPLIGTNYKTIKSLNKIFKIQNNDLFSLSKTFNSKGEEIYYIDYLSEPNEDYYNLLCQNVDKNRDKPRVLLKYTWLLKQFNYKFKVHEHCPKDLQEAIL